MLRRSSIRQSVASVALDRGDILATFEAKFLGSSPTAAPTGNDVCMDAVTRLHKLKIKPTNVDVVITNKGVYVDSKKKHTLIKKVPLANLSWAATDPRNKYLFSFICHEPRLNTMECYTFSMKKAGKAFVKACNQALSNQAATTHRAEAEAHMIAATTPIMPVREEAPQRRISADAIDEEEDFELEVDDPWVGQEYINMALGCFKAEYCGGIPVLDIEGYKVVKNAAEKIEELKFEPKEVTLVVTEGQLILVERETGDHLQENPISFLSYSLLDPNDNTRFYYIINNPRLGFAYCHFLKLLSGFQAIERCIAAAQRAAAKDRHRMLEKQDLLGRIKTTKRDMTKQNSIGVHEVRYLGAVRVSQPNGNEVVVDAMNSLKEKFCEVLNISEDDDWTLVGDKVVVAITLEGIRVVELTTGDIIHFTFIRNMSFSTYLHSGVNSEKNAEQDVFAYIEIDEKLSRNVCHMFKCPAGMAREIFKTASHAFSLSMEDMEKHEADNPFQAIALSDGDISDLFPPHLIINRKDIKAIKILGAGQFGTVWLALHRIRRGTAITHKHRAVKLLRPGASDLDQEDFIAEALTMSKLDHPNLVSLVGVSVSSVPWLVVVEFMRYGDLKTVLVASKEKGITLRYVEQLYFAFQIASGMAYLASKRYVHMDLAARNCLLHKDNIVKVGDFGLTKAFDEGEDHYKLKPNTTAKLPAKWMAPESLERFVFSEATDVWACGITFWELMTYGEQPYPEYKNKEMRRMLRRGIRLSQPKDCPDEFHVEVAKCWKSAIVERHSFKTLKERLRILLEAEKKRMDLSELQDVGLLLNNGIEKELPTNRETSKEVYSSFTAKGNSMEVRKVVKKIMKNDQGEYVEVEVAEEVSDEELEGMNIGKGTLSRLPDNYLAILNRALLGENEKLLLPQSRNNSSSKPKKGRLSRDEGAYFAVGEIDDMYIEVEAQEDAEGSYIEVGCRRSSAGVYSEIVRRMDDQGEYIELERTVDDHGDYIEIQRVMNEDGDYIEIGRQPGSEDNYLHIEELHNNDYMEIEANITGGDWFGDNIQRLNPLFQGTYIDMDDMEEDDEEEGSYLDIGEQIT